MPYCYLDAAASQLEVLGFELSADAIVCGYPERYKDPDGSAMWEILMSLLGRAEDGGGNQSL